MLIILSGCETIHKKWWAKKILSALNTFEIDGYKIDFSSDQFKVFDADNNLVYQLHHDESEGWPPQPPHPISSPITGNHPVTGEKPKDIRPPITYRAGSAGVNVMYNPAPTYPGEAPEMVPCIEPLPQVTLDKIFQLYYDIFLDGVRNNHHQNYFVDNEYEFGLVDPNTPPLWESKGKQFHHFNGYEDVIKNYNNRPTPYHVISGAFSNRFIDRIKKDLGSENVHVINIIRHPSVVYAVHEKGNEYYEAKPSMSTDIDDAKVFISIENAVLLYNNKTIQHVKYEDVLRDGYFMLFDKKIELPDNYTPYNEWITTWEYGHFCRHIVNNFRMGTFNTMLKDGGIKQILLEEHNKTPVFPDNVFTALGYERPLSRIDIGKPLAK